MSHYRPKKRNVNRKYYIKKYQKIGKKRKKVFKPYDYNKNNSFSKNSSYLKYNNYSNKSGDIDFMQLTLKGLVQVTREGLIALKDIIFNKRRY